MPLPHVSRRAAEIIASPIRKFVPSIMAAEDRGAEFIKLHIGDPDLAPPPRLLAGIRGYKAATIPYAPSSGLPKYAAAWVKYYAQLGVRLAPSNVVPTVGAAEAIHMAMLCVADPGDEVIVFEPLYTGFKASARMHGVTLVPVTLSLDEGFRLPGIDAVEAKVTPKTRAIVVINPDNPTGKSWTRKELDAVMDLAERKGLFVISDETYREIVFEGKPSCMLRHPKADRVIVCDSLSKRFSAPGARLGCVASLNAEVMGSMLKFAMARLSAPTVEQLAVVPLLEKPAVYVAKAVREYKKRRDAVVAATSKIKGVRCHVPAGAFYAVARLPVRDTEDFVRFLINDFRDGKRSLTLTPMKDFYATPGLGMDEVRIALVRDAKTIAVAMRLLDKALARYASLGR